MRYTIADTKRPVLLAARLLLAVLTLLFFLPLAAQPESDEELPIAKGRFVSAKLFKFNHQLKSDQANHLQALLALAGAVFTAGFYLGYVRLHRQRDFGLWPVAFYSPVRAPPFLPHS